LILKCCVTALIADWLTRTKKTPELNHLHLTDEERTGHLPKLVDDLIARLARAEMTTQDSDAMASPAAAAHGRLRDQQGCSAAMLIHESGILQVTIFGTLQRNLNALDFSVLLPDVMTIRGRSRCPVDSDNDHLHGSLDDEGLKVAGCLASRRAATFPTPALISMRMVKNCGSRSRGKEAVLLELNQRARKHGVVPVDDDSAEFDLISEEPQDKGFEVVRVVSVAATSRRVAQSDLTL
jgi:hypothetical protein